MGFQISRLSEDQIHPKICDNHRLVVTSSFAFYVITFEPIEVQTRSVPQNDCLNISFVKNKDVDGRKFTTIYIS